MLSWLDWTCFAIRRVIYHSILVYIPYSIWGNALYLEIPGPVANQTTGEAWRDAETAPFHLSSFRCPSQQPALLCAPGNHETTVKTPRTFCGGYLSNMLYQVCGAGRATRT